VKLYSPFAKKIPLNPPFSKGEFAQRGAFPLFEKEGQGEILDKCEARFASACSPVFILGSAEEL
jgi:hypothetical protein